MNATPLWHRLLWRCLLILGFWTALGLVDAGQSCYLLVCANQPIVWWRVLATAFSDWYLWAALTPLVLWLVRHYPIVRPQRAWRIFFHLVVSLALTFLVIDVTALVLPFTCTFGSNLNFELRFDRAFEMTWTKLHEYVLLYWLIVVGWHLWESARQAQERALRASQLEARLAQAQLQVLKMQLHPHFLFNTLNAISALIHHDVEAADRMLARLGELLRLTLENANAQEVPLRRELEMINPYLEIQQSRLGSRLAVRMDIDPEAMDACVPNLVLQPLVENAIQRGIAPRPGGGRLELSARRIGDKLQLLVRDEGPPYPNGHSGDPEAVELSTTRSRLQQLYGAGCRVTLEDGPPGSHLLTLEIPFHGGDP
jgi:signal transduction histidine kinase